MFGFKHFPLKKTGQIPYEKYLCRSKYGSCIDKVILYRMGGMKEQTGPVLIIHARRFPFSISFATHANLETFRHFINNKTDSQRG